MDFKHKTLFENAMHDTGTAYPPNIAAIYLLSAHEDTRADFWTAIFGVCRRIGRAEPPPPTPAACWL